MKTDKFLISTICICLMCTSYVYGTGEFYSQPKISGVFKIGSEKKPDSIAVGVLSRFNEVTLSFMLKVGPGGDFTFKLPQSNDVQRFKISYQLSTNSYKDLGPYYAEPTDDVFVHISGFSKHLSKDSLYFSGSGAPKYNLIEALNNDYRRFVFESEKKHPSVFTYQNISNYLVNKSELLKIFNEKKARSIKDFDKIVSSDIRDIIKFQFADYFSNWNNHLQLLYLKHCVGKSELEILVRNYFNLFKDDFFLKLDNRLSIFSPRVLAEFANWHKTQQILNSKSGSINLTDYYDSIKKNSHGKTREALLTGFFRSNQTFTNIKDFEPSTYDSLVLDAQQYITSLDAKEIILAKAKTRSGSTLYNANFIDSNGEYVSTSSLKGKVVLIDFWGDGCGGCLLFHHWFEKNIWPKFKDNKEFVFLSVSIDRNKEVWLNNIEKYSSRAYLNVNTDGLGLLDHPFGKYYNIRAVPFLMLIDKRGCIISKINLGISSADFIKLINFGLDHKVSK